jgi:hypothetical protein
MSTERQKAAARAHYWRYHEQELERMSRYRATHRDYFRAKHRQYGIDHRAELNAKARERSRIYRQQHPHPPRVSHAMSREERLARRCLYWQANRERLNAKRRENYHRNEDKEHERARSYRRRNRNALRVRGRARYWRERDKNLERARRYYQEHKAEHAAKQKLYRNNPVNRARRCERRRALYRSRFGWHVKNLLRQQARKRAYQRRQAKLLTTAYVRRLLCRGTNLKPEDFPLAIVRVARAKLRLLRSVRLHRKKQTNA